MLKSIFSILICLNIVTSQEICYDVAINTTYRNITIPISYVVLHMSNGTGRVPYSQLVSQTQELNYAFSAQDAVRKKYSKPISASLNFYTAGVRYVTNDTLFNLCTLPSYYSIYRPKYMMNPARHINVYICWNKNMYGQSYLPYDPWFGQPINESHYSNGPVIHWELLSDNKFNKGIWSQGLMLIHEMGHTFGLKHPYQGDCEGTESNSDNITDTPRMKGNPVGSCSSLKGRDSCQKLPGKDDISNYMLITYDTCKSHFTQGQVDYMRSVISWYKPTLNSNNTVPDCVASTDTLDNSPDLAPCISGSVVKNKNGQLICRTNPDNSSVWAYACCPSGPNWPWDSCRTGPVNL